MEIVTYRAELLNSENEVHVKSETLGFVILMWVRRVFVIQFLAMSE